MGWKAEAKEVKNKKYSAYCVMCDALNQERLPYHKFELKDYHAMKLLKKQQKQSDKD